MKGDFSRQTFDPHKHYTAVLMQQGRVQVDADWNEQRALDLYRTLTEAGDIIGPCGAPVHNAGFAVTTDGTTLSIGAGRYYVDGLLCENEAPVSYEAQPDLPGAPAIRALLEQANSSFGLVYLDVWQRHITVLDDVRIREVALGGPDTTTRVKTVWQVKVLPIAQQGSNDERRRLLDQRAHMEARIREHGRDIESVQDELRELRRHQDELPEDSPLREQLDERLREVATRLDELRQQVNEVAAINAAITALDRQGHLRCDTEFEEWNRLATTSGTLRARTMPHDESDDPCMLPPSAGYTRLENQLYRVEVHSPGSRGTATFKWSRDNGTVVTTIEQISGTTLIVSDLGRDDVLGFAPGDWVEVSDDTRELNGLPGELVQIDGVQAERRVITLKSAPTLLAGTLGGLDRLRHPKLRRWDQTGDSASANGIRTGADWMVLEHGIEVQFGEAEYRTGDYWLIPARTATSEIEWPPFQVPNTTPSVQPPLGIRHHYCRLALLTVTNDNLEVVEDCRHLFSPLTTLPTTPTSSAMHVVDISWRNDDFLPGDLRRLRITLDAPPAQQSVSDASVIVSAEVPYPEIGSPEAAQNVIVPGTVHLDPQDPQSITWRISRDTFFAQIQQRSTRLRVILKGHAIWTDTGQQRLYLDGQAFGRPGLCGDNVTPCTELIFPTGDRARASDFESWFYIGTRFLQIKNVRFVTMNGDASSAGNISFPRTSSEPVQLGTREHVNVIEVEFNGPVSPESISLHPRGLHSIRVFMDREGTGVPLQPVVGDLQLVEPRLVRFTAHDPQIFLTGLYELVAFGDPGPDGPTIVRSLDDNSALDGDHNSIAGGNFRLQFSVP